LLIIAHVWRYTNELRRVTGLHVGILVLLARMLAKIGDYIHNPG